MARALAWMLVASLWAAAAHAEPPKLSALITDEQLDELSGLAVSRRHPGMLWAHNDGGNSARLYAVDTRGEVRARYAVRGAPNIDWEDLASYERDGRGWLLLADTGDNGGVRNDLVIHAFEEPGTLADGELQLAWSLHFRWPDGPRDCEAMSVDPVAGEILLVSKKRVPPELFRLPLRAAPAAQPLVAERIALLRGIAQPTAEDLRSNPMFGRYRAQITSIDLSADGLAMAVLNYRQAYLYRRARGETWERALQRRPRDLPFPWLPQAEALSFDADASSVWISSERLPAALIEVPVAE